MPEIHPFILIIDYILGVIMWTLIGRVAMNIISTRKLRIFFYESFCKINKSINSFI